MLVLEIPALLTETRPFLARHSCVHDRRRRDPLGGSGCMLPQEKKLRYVLLRCHFLHFEITVNGK